MSKALTDVLQVLGQRRDFEEWQETVSTFILNLAAAPTEESAQFANMPRHEITISENVSRKLERAYRYDELRGCCYDTCRLSGIDWSGRLNHSVHDRGEYLVAVVIILRMYENRSIAA